MKNLLKPITLVLLLVMLIVPVLAACGAVEFSVNFVVDGEVYSTVSTNGQEVIKLPENPTKEGYDFKGWFWDEGVWEKPFTANSLLDAPLTGDMSVYAKFDKIGTATVVTSPVPGTAYKLFMDQENIGTRVYLNGIIDGYHFATTTDIEKSVNVYVEETTIPGKLGMFCVKDGERKYINIVMGDNGMYCASFNNSAITTYTFDSDKNTMVASIDGQSIILGAATNNNYKRIGARYLNEQSFISHFVISTTPDETIPDAAIEESNIKGIIDGALGKYKTSGTVVALNKQSFLISDGTEGMLVFCGLDWERDVNIGDTVTVSGDVVEYGLSKQFGVGADYTVTGSASVTYPDVAVPTAAELDAYATASRITPLYGKVIGTLSISGSYYNVTINDTTIIGSIVAPIDDLSSLNGKTVEVIGYLSSVTGGARYLNIIATSVTEFTGTLPNPPVVEKNTIAEIKAGAVGATYVMDGTIIGVNAQSFLVADSTGAILVYFGKNWTPDVEVGSKVTVTGTTSTYGGAVQFGNTSTYTVNGTETVTHPTAKEPTAAELDAYGTASPVNPDYIKIKGVLTISGSYYNIAIEGANITGSITYPIGDLSALNGKTVEVVGYVTGVTGSGSFLNVMTISVTEVVAD